MSRNEFKLLSRLVKKQEKNERYTGKINQEGKGRRLDEAMLLLGDQPSVF